MGFNVRKSRAARKVSGRETFLITFTYNLTRQRDNVGYTLCRLDQFEHDAFNWRNFVIDLIKCPYNDPPLPLEPPPEKPPKNQQTEVEKTQRMGDGRTKKDVQRLEARSLFAKNSCGFHCLLLNNWFLNKSYIALLPVQKGSRPKGLDWLNGVKTVPERRTMASSIRQKQLITNSMLTHK